MPRKSNRQAGRNPDGDDGDEGSEKKKSLDSLHSSESEWRVAAGGYLALHTSTLAAARNFKGPTNVPLSMYALAVVRAHHQTVTQLQLCDNYGQSPFTFIQISPMLLRPFAGTAFYEMELKHSQRKSVMCSGFRVIAAELTCGGCLEFHASSKTSHRLMNWIARRVASGHMATTPEALFMQGLQLYIEGSYALAVKNFTLAASRGHLRARAELAWLLLHGRDGVCIDADLAMQLVQEGTRLGCMDCQGVYAWCLVHQRGRAPIEPRHRVCHRALLQAFQSARTSKFGQVLVGMIYEHAYEQIVIRNLLFARHWFHLAAEQGLDVAQMYLAWMWRFNVGEKFGGRRGSDDEQQAAEEKTAELYSTAACQGLPEACSRLAQCYENGVGVQRDQEMAIHWYKRAAAGGNVQAARYVAELERV